MKHLETKNKETTYVIELTEREAKLIWHRLNLSDAGFEREYSDFGGDWEEYRALYSDMTQKGYALWGFFDKILSDD